MTLSARECDAHIREIVRRYDRQWGADFSAHLTGNENLAARNSTPLHVTGSALPVNHDKSEILFIHHNFLNKWLQPGGHMDAGERPDETALRELSEETGLRGALITLPGINTVLPLSIDVHDIPANPARGEPAHRHFDLKYLMSCSGTLRPDLSEVGQAKWFSIEALLQLDPAGYTHLKELF